MADAQIFPLLGHQMLTAVQESTRSPHELLGISPDKCRTRAADLVLAHPPVLWINAGGGEQLLNHDAVNSQLSYRQCSRHGNELPVGLRCWIIDQNALKKNATLLLLYSLLFGPIQNLFYQKKQGGKLSWKIIMQKIEKDEHLKNIIEHHLFDGEDLAPRHYKILLSAALVGESSINHELGKIRRKKSKNNEKETSGLSIEKPSAVIINKSKEKNKNSDHGDPITSNENQKENQKNFNMKESLANITRAADKSVRRSSYEQSVGEEDV